MFRIYYRTSQYTTFESHIYHSPSRAISGIRIHESFAPNFLNLPNLSNLRDPNDQLSNTDNHGCLTR